MVKNNSRVADSQHHLSINSAKSAMNGGHLGLPNYLGSSMPPSLQGNILFDPKMQQQYPFIPHPRQQYQFEYQQSQQIPNLPYQFQQNVLNHPQSYHHHGPPLHTMDQNFAYMNGPMDICQQRLPSSDKFDVETSTSYGQSIFCLY